MPRKPSLLLLFIWTFLISTVISRDIGLGNDFTSLVPGCARSCLLSFIRSNYPKTDCGDKYTLQCLCSAESLSGFTVGEAALQCLLGDVQLGQCSEDYLAGPAPLKVHNMCNGVPNALPNTHSTLTATLVIPSSGGVPALLPPTASLTATATSTSTSSWTTKTKSSASSTSVSSSSSSATFGSFPTLTTAMTSSIPVGTATSTATSSPTSTSTPEATPSKATLAPGQIAGISVGVIGAIGIAVAAIFMAKCMRRRKYPDYDSEKGFYEHDNSTRGSSEPKGPRGSHIFHISPPILRMSRYRPDFIPRAAPPVPQPSRQATPANNGDLDRGTIGLAISRPRSQVPPRLSQPQWSVDNSPQPVQEQIERRRSRLLPERPTLTLDIPPKPQASGSSSSNRIPTTDRTSTMTNMTAFADLDTEAAEGEQVWRPPPSDPLSATTLYVADKYGNWVLSNDKRRSQMAEVISAPAESVTPKPLTKSPVEMQEEAANISAAAGLPRAPQPAFLSRDPSSYRSSTIYSQVSAPRLSGRRGSSGRNSMSRSRKNSGSAPDRSNSKDSVTTIQSYSSTEGSGDGFSCEPDIARLSQLSPVKESPDPPTGRSQVTYPKIPGLMDGATIRYVPPPKRPDFSSYPSNRTSSTLEVVYPIMDSPSAYPSPLKPKRHGSRPFAPLQRTGSGFTPEPPNVDVFPSQNPAPTYGMTAPGWQPQAYPTSMRAYEPYRPPNSQQQGGAVRTPPQQTVPTFTPSPMSASGEKDPRHPTSPPRTDNGDRLRAHIASQYNNNNNNNPNNKMSTNSFRSSESSSASSLLAKRLGNDRAAALALDPRKQKAQQWRRRREDNDGGVVFSPDMFSLASPVGPTSKGTLPMTPTWQPKLTPTRRGDDLYLNVQ
ncbi:hypothetical protein GGS20DRAFT_431784 [Poronia punctata]|nr:hypothetical protein GGS20DRAFT_431784 [Poronia punctata]